MGLNLGFDFGSTTSVLSLYNSENGGLQTINLDSGLPYVPSKVSHSKKDARIKFGASAKADIGNSKYTVYEAFKTLLNNDIDDPTVVSRGYDEQNTPTVVAAEFIDLLLRRIMKDHNVNEIDNLCIGVPENWGKSVRTVRSSNAIQQAKGTQRLTDILSGLDYIKKYKVVFEPEAASAFFAYNYNRLKKDEKRLNGNLLIIDYGGGSLDITLSKIETSENGKMEIALIDSEGLGENQDGMVGSAGILYIESLMRCAMNEAGIDEELLNDPNCKGSIEKIRTEIETKLRDNKEDIREVFESGNVRDTDFMEELDEAYLCEDLMLKCGGKCYLFNVTYSQLYRVYARVIKPELDQILNLILDRNKEIDTEAEDFKLGLVGGFSNFYFVRKQIWDKFRISNSDDPHVEGLLTNPEEQEKAISLGAALIANDMIKLCVTSEFAIGIFTKEDINGQKGVAVPHFAIEYRQEIKYNTVYYSMMLGGQHRQIIMSPNGTIDQLIILREKDDRHIMVLTPDPIQGKKLQNVIKYKAQVGFSISEDNVITVHVMNGEDAGFGKFEVQETKEIVLSDFDNLFSNYAVPIGEDYPFSTWLKMVKDGTCPRR